MKGIIIEKTDLGFGTYIQRTVSVTGAKWQLPDFQFPDGERITLAFLRLALISRLRDIQE